MSKAINKKSDPIQAILNCLAGAAFIGAVLRVTASGKDLFDRLDTTTLLYLAVAGALLMMRQVKSLAFGDFKVELDQVKKVAEEARSIAQIADNAAQYQVTQQPTPLPKIAPPPAAAASPQSGAPQTTPASTPQLPPIAPGTHDDDPWKGVFGEKPEMNNRRLSAVVTPMADDSDWYKIHLVVESTSPKNAPLKGTVQFFLHDSFNNDRPQVPVRQDGIAELYLKAWGAFTVGVLADEGATRLELDLAELPDAPYKFRIN
ncbi:hypothetical protein KI809_17060 [Geobacter pelophilus]|uniref:Prokaryotic YEATS domain-containing protein n=1 Tax=Geoanaerobacter pelophilus TaxID=60036 RepID=A0AAW4LDD9_9BACT|nr:pYEATS domain-containing protein [Geoanaerobacter pelophilus]MBT0666024.1 hypothetical protein [Geoanaerobacter pelophilus]